MKKILFIISLLIFCSVVNAQEIITADDAQKSINELVNTTQKPTDDEIRQAIDKFNFTPEQKETLFLETKKNLDALYSQVQQQGTQAAPQPADDNAPAEAKPQKKYSKHGKIGPKH